MKYFILFVAFTQCLCVADDITHGRNFSGSLVSLLGWANAAIYAWGLAR